MDSLACCASLALPCTTGCPAGACPAQHGSHCLSPTGMHFQHLCMAVHGQRSHPQPCCRLLRAWGFVGQRSSGPSLCVIPVATCCSNPVCVRSDSVPGCRRGSQGCWDAARQRYPAPAVEAAAALVALCKLFWCASGRRSGMATGTARSETWLTACALAARSLCSGLCTTSTPPPGWSRRAPLLTVCRPGHMMWAGGQLQLLVHQLRPSRACAELDAACRRWTWRGTSLAFR